LGLFVAKKQETVLEAYTHALYGAVGAP